MINHHTHVAPIRGATIVRDAITMRDDGEFITTSLCVADGLQVHHHTLLHLIRKHAADLSEFGDIEYLPHPERAVLTEPQALLLVVCLGRRTDGPFKRRLSESFARVRGEAATRTFQFHPHLARDLWSQPGQLAARQAMVAV